MKMLLTLLALMLANLASAVTPEEEVRFLNAVRDAYAKMDKAAIVALTCWDRVTEQHKALAPKVIDYAVSRPIKSAEYRPVDPSQAAWTFTKDGITYGPNLTVIKQVELEYEDIAGTPHMKSTLFAGEKDGKLMIVNLAPQP